MTESAQWADSVKISVIGIYTFLHLKSRVKIVSSQDGGESLSTSQLLLLLGSGGSSQLEEIEEGRTQSTEGRSPVFD